MKILCLGDVVGKPGRLALQQSLDEMRKRLQIDLVVVNAENSAGGSGLTSRIARNLFRMGCDVITLGDHVWDQKELEVYLDQGDPVIRPANFPEGAPGRGWIVVETAAGVKVGVMNLLGRVFMRHAVRCPFRMADAMIEKIKKQTPIIVLDMHAETTSEKVAMGHYLNGKVTVVFGTHTHIPTADECVLSEGTAYITDLGMTGPYDSVIGQEKENIIKRFLTSMPVRFHVAKNDVRIHGIVVDIDDVTGKALTVLRVCQPVTIKEN